MFEDYNNEDEEMAPVEESFPPEEESSPSGGNPSFGSRPDFRKDAKLSNKIFEPVARGKHKNTKELLNKRNNNKNDSNTNDQEQKDQNSELEKKKDEAARKALTESLVAAAASVGIPEPVARKILESEKGQEILQKRIDAAKKKVERKKKRIMIAIGAGFFAILSLILLVTNQQMSSLDSSIPLSYTETEEANENSGHFFEKLGNFIIGNGWNTNRKRYIDALEEAYDNCVKTKNQEIDLALISSTVHYNYVIDTSVFEDEDDYDFEDYDEDTSYDDEDYDDDEYYDDDDGGEVTKDNFNSFYNRAISRLGSFDSRTVGEKLLFGHLFGPHFTKTTATEEVAIAMWNKVFEYFGIEKLTEKEFLKKFENDDLLFNYIKEYIAKEYRSKAKNAPLIKNFKNLIKQYEAKEVLDILDQAFDENTIGTVGYDANGKKLWPVLQLDIYYDEEFYYDYLVKYYIPVEMFKGKEYDESEVTKIALEIFDQRDLYNTMFDIEAKEANKSSGCKYVYNVDGQVSASIAGKPLTTSLIDNLYIELYPGTCKKISECSNTPYEDILSMEDYVMGVAWSEIAANNSSNEEYVKANMVAIQSYAFMQNGSTIREENGKYYIKMLNNTYNQTYCSVYSGCMDRTSNKKGPQTDESIQYLRDLYKKVKYEVLYKESGGYAGQYRAHVSQCINAGITGSCMGQNDAKSDALLGSDYKNILGKYYTDNIKILNIASGSTSSAVYQCYSAGLVAGEHGDIMIRTSIPKAGDIYFDRPYLKPNNVGQCAWYAKGRAIEIVATTVTDSDKRYKALSVLQGFSANGNGWYSSTLQAVFGSSSDPMLPKPGSIASYDWDDGQCRSYYSKRGETGCPQKFGHVLIVEDVNYETQTVTYSEGWTTCDVRSRESVDWNCVHFSVKTVPLSSMATAGGAVFKGYIYLLD